MTSDNDSDWPDCDDTCTTPRPNADIEAVQKDIEKTLEEFPFNTLSVEAKQKFIERSKAYEAELKRKRRAKLGRIRIVEAERPEWLLRCL